MEHLMVNGYNKKSIEEAESIFQKDFDKEYDEDLPKRGYKLPEFVKPALEEYCAKYAGDWNEFQLVEAEIAGSLMVCEDPVRLLYFKMDSICRRLEDGHIFSLEHKTGSGLRDWWIRQWLTSMQVSTYYHALKCIFPVDQVDNIVIDGIHFSTKSYRELIRVPIRRTDKMLLTWLWEVNDWMDQLDSDMERLASCSEGDSTMQAFARNDNSCIRYMACCPFIGFCSIWPNPLQYVNILQPGFKVEFWNPMAKLGPRTKKLEAVK